MSGLPLPRGPRALSRWRGAAATPSPTRGTRSIARGPLARSRMDEDLRILTDEIGGRSREAWPTSGAAVGTRSFPAGGSGLRRSSSPTRARPVGGRVARGPLVVSPVRFPLHVVSFALAPSTAGKLKAPLVDAGEGAKADFEKLGRKARGAIVLVRSKPMRSFEDLFAEYLGGPEMLQRRRRMRTPPRSSSFPRGRGISSTATRSRGTERSVSIPMAQVSREDGLRLARLLDKSDEPRRGARDRKPDRRTVEASERRGGDPRIREARGDRAPRRAPRLVGPRNRRSRQRRQLRARRRGGPRDRRGPAARSGPCDSCCSRGRRSGSSAPAATSPLTATKWTGTSPSSSTTSATAGSSATSPTAAPSSDPALAKRPWRPWPSWGAGGPNDEAILGTDNFDFLLEGVPTSIANQETARYLADYHAGVRHVRQGGPRAGAEERGRSPRSRSPGSPTRRRGSARGSPAPRWRRVLAEERARRRR